MNLAPMNLVTDAWMLLLAYWLITAWNVKRVKYVAPSHVRITQLIFLVPGCVLLFADSFRKGVLRAALLPKTSVIADLGIAITFAGIAFAIWARYCLGRNWSSEVAIKQDHELVQSGPYRWIRHPIYTGIITAAWGTAIVVGQLGGLLGVILITMGFAYKGRQEELRLRGAFGDSWAAHEQRTGMFLPRVRRT